MKLIELIGVIIIIGTVISFLFIEDGINQARINDVSSKFQGQITDLFNQSFTNLTRMTSDFQQSLSQKQTEIDTKNQNIIDLNSQLSAIQSKYQLLNTSFGLQLNLKVAEMKLRLQNVSQQLNETLATLLKKPTQAQLVSFLSNDTTNTHKYNNTNYSSNYYICTDFSRSLIKNATIQKFKSAPVMMDLQNKTTFTITWHCIVAFNTTDYGVVFVEPQTDVIYHNLTYNSTYGAFNKTIKHMVILGVI